MQNIRIAADLVAVVIGVLTLPTGNPYFLLLAIADITLAGADITIQVFKEEILKCEGGAEFLETWEKIYTVGGFAVAGLTLVGGFYIGAARLLTKIADGSAKTYLKTLILKAVLETNITNFQKNTLKVLEPQEIFLEANYKAMGQEMAENGVVFVTGQREGKYQLSYAGIYKGEVIMDFDKAELSRVFKDWWRLKGEKMLELLEWRYSVGILKKNNYYAQIIKDYESGVLKRIYKELLTVEEEASIRLYTTDEGFREINTLLREGKDLSKELDAQKTLMNLALSKLPDYKIDKLLYRIESLSEKEISNIYKVGETIESKQFVSATYSEDAIAKIMRKGNYTLLIRIEGKTGKLIEKISKFPEENEILFATDRKFFVKEIGFEYNPLEPWTPIKRIILIEK